MKAKKVLIIFNPEAGQASRPDLKKILEQKMAQLAWRADWFILDKNFEKKIAGYDFAKLALVLAIGGDGTVKVAANLILKNQLNLPLAIIPFGSANIIATELGLPLNISKAIAALSNDFKVSRIDVGLINNRHYFLVGFSLGAVSRIITNTSLNLKKRFGFLSYLFNLFGGRLKIKKLKLNLATKSQKLELSGNSLVIFNAVNYRGLKPRRKVDLADGIFNLFVFTNQSFFSLLVAFFYALFWQKPPRHLFALDGDYFKITLPRKISSCQVDGDYLALPELIEIKVLPKSLGIVVNKSMGQ